MKIKQLRRVVAGLFPAEFAPTFERAYTTREIDLIATTLKIALGHANKQAQDFAIREAVNATAYNLLEDRVGAMEKLLKERQTPVQVATVREPQEEVFLCPPPLGPPTAGNFPADLRNKIGLIKGVREVSGLGLKEAKDLVEDVLDHGNKRSIFKGSLEKAAIAVRVLAAVGGVTERKEAF